MFTKKTYGVVCLAAAAVCAAWGQNGKSQVACEVAIVGGGAGGLHTAFRLGPQMGNKVCLIEREDRLGGRINDVSKDGSPNSPRFGLGALRIMETQDVVFGLAAELGIQYETVPFDNDRIIARGNTATNSDVMRSLAYPLANPGGEGALYDALFQNQANAKNYPDFRSYVRATVGGENTNFLADVFRFRGDFTYPLSANGYMDFLAEDYNVCCTPSYPVGGMSEFIRRMEAKAVQSGVRIFKSQPALEINNGSGGGYQIVTPDYNFRANRLVIAVDAEAFKKVGGTLAARIQSQPQFQDIIGVKVASIDQWWPSAWWKNAPNFAGNRAWSTETCVNFIEIPTAKYAADQLVTRSVYNDDLNCTNFWEITAQRGTAAVEAEIKRGLQSMFPGATIPNPDKTVVKIWPAGWYWLKAGSTFTNADMAVWAILPLGAEPVSLVGESYNPQRSTWSDGAYKSSINTLNSLYGFQLAGQTASPGGPLPGFGKGKKVPPGLVKRGR